MIDLNKYLTDVVFFEDNSAELQPYLINTILSLNQFMDVSDELLGEIATIFENQLQSYGNVGYRFVPIYLEDELLRVKAIIDYWKLLMVRDGQWSTTLGLVDGKLKLLGLTSGLTDTVEYGGKETVEDEKLTAYGKDIERDVNSNRKSMSENAPINADIETINTPDNKGSVVDSSNSVESHTGTDTVTVNRSTDKSGSDKRTYDSPDRYQLYLDILKEYNVYTMVDRFIRTTIYECNRVM